MGALRSFLRFFPKARLIVTSQSMHPDDLYDFKRYFFPDEVSGMVLPVLKVWLGAERAAMYYTKIVQNGLVHDLRNVFDIQLLADMVEGGWSVADIPSRRVEIFEYVFEEVSRNLDDKLLDELLFLVAESIVLRTPISISDRRFDSLSFLTVKGFGFWVLEESGFRKLELGHDQLRCYMACRWVEKVSVNEDEVMSRIKFLFDSPLHDQVHIWHFYFASITNVLSLQIKKWASREKRSQIFCQALLEFETQEKSALACRLK